MVTFYASLSLVSASISFLIGSYVFIKNPRSHLNIVFLLLCYSVSYWSYTEHEIRAAANISIADKWVWLNFVWPLTGPLALHFALVYTKKVRLLRNPLTYAVLYLPMLLVVVDLIATGKHPREPVLQSWGWSAGPSGPFYFMADLGVSVYAVLAVLVCFFYHISKEKGPVKGQSGFVTLGLLIPVSTGIFADFLSPMLGFDIPEMTSASFAFGSASFIGYAIRKYELFSITPSTVANEILNTMSDGLMLIDADYRITFSNEASQRMLRYTGSQLQGASFDMAFSSSEDREQYHNLINDDSVNAACAVEISFRSETGDEIPVSLSISKIRDKEGEFIGFICVAHDISGIKEKEKELRDSETRYRTLFETSPDGVCVTDIAGTIVMANEVAARVTGYDSPDEMIGMKYNQFLTPGDRATLAEEMPQMISTGVMNAEYTILRRDGTTVPVEVSVSPLLDQEKNPQGLVAIIRDISRRKRSEKQVARQQEDLKERNLELEAQYAISRAVSEADNVDELISRVLASMMDLREIFHAEAQSGLILVEGERMRLAGHAGGQSRAFEDLHADMKMGECLCGLAALTGEIIVSEDSATDERHTIRDPDQESHGHIILPLKTMDRVVGVLYMYFPAGTVELSGRRMKLLQSIGNRIATAIENVRLHEQTRELSLHDPLTGLANRRLMDIELERSMARAKRTDVPFSLVMLDLDRFKDYNDMYGHTAGDKLLADISRLIEHEIREVDLATRYGGEEFMLILPDTGAETALEIAERIRSRIESTDFLLPGGRQITHMTISLGVATHDEAVTQADFLVARADSALYRAKSSGRNRVESWLPQWRPAA